ncbi:putative spermidine/putrescine transport system permease protein [Tistlia consotensis]|uniref:Putative spermidine/putrescine transport system permease protein n=1 Tax=Tistlia consotensis USBA 355 TaxID=560819 RepID=A0A1Y6BYJ8_9PROT|nr:ABC transporter permease [Tistlia consotensis]SMF32152.1 putative spermidine/putrescine transport system permease protein [Tistlia consotensis USBA 355]SNR68210.1 putative spermidine/putrescine transport system permease protein [Tistlia consotensis]
MRRWLDRSGFGLLSAPLLVLLCVFVAPLLVLLPTSFHPYQPGRGIGTAWTLTNYAQILGDGFYLEIIARTLGLGLIVVAATLLVGYPLAYFLARTRSRLRPWLIILVIFPLLLNLVVRSFGWIVLLSNHGLVNDLLIALQLIERPLKLMFNFTGLLVGLSHIFLPFMVLVLIGTIQNIPRDVEDAARTLGASRWTVLREVTLPLSLPGILSGSILVFVLTISALVTPRLLGGPTYQVMSTLIYDEFLKILNWPRGAAMAFILTAIVLLLVWASGRLARRWASVR